MTRVPDDSARPPRPVRSFVLREGRLTPGQRRALETLWPHYGIDRPGEGEAIDWSRAFGRPAPLWLEIGFGNGDALRQIAAMHPHVNCLGIEVHRPGVGRLLRGLADDGLANVRVMCADAAEVLRSHLAEATFERILVFFPDPWPKKRHHKRRLIQPAIADELARVLVPGGELHLATDWPDYAEHMHAVLEAAPPFANTADGWAERPAYRPRTRFEARGEDKGHPVFDLIYRRR